MTEQSKHLNLDTLKEASRNFGARELLRHLQASPNLTQAEKARIQDVARGYFGEWERVR